MLSMNMFTGRKSTKNESLTGKERVPSEEGLSSERPSGPPSFLMRPNQVMQLQQTIGNRAVQRMVTSNTGAVTARSLSISDMPHPVLQRYSQGQVDKAVSTMYRVKEDEPTYKDAETQVKEILEIGEATGLFAEIFEMAVSGLVLNPDGLHKTLTAFRAKIRESGSAKKTSTSKTDNEATKSGTGFVREILFALEQIKAGNTAQFGTMLPDNLRDALNQSGKEQQANELDKIPIGLGYGWGGDSVVWGSNVETIQHKVVEGALVETVKREIIKAVKQLNGQNEEVALEGSTKIADIVVMPTNLEWYKLNTEEMQKVVTETLASNTFRKKNLDQIVDLVRITSGDQQYSFAIKEGTVELTSVEKSDVVVKLTQKSTNKYDEKAIKRPPDKQIADKKPLVPVTEDPQKVRSKKIEELKKSIAVIEKGRTTDLAKDEITKASLDTRQKRIVERNKWKSVDKLRTDISWASEYPSEAKELAEAEIVVDKAINKWEIDNKDTNFKTLEKFRSEKQTLEKEHKDVQDKIVDLEKARQHRVTYVDEQIKTDLKSRYQAQYKEEKAVIKKLTDLWRKEDEDRFMQRVSELRNEWAINNPETALKAKEADEREANGTGGNKMLNEKKERHRKDNQVLIEESWKNNDNLLNIVSTILGNSEKVDLLALNIGRIKSATGNRKKVNELMHEVAQELTLAHKYTPNKISEPEFKQATEDMCKGAEFVNFQGHMAEFRHANRAAANLSDEAITPIYIGTKKWDEKDMDSKRELQEVDVSYIEKDNVMYLCEVAYDFETLEKKLVGNKVSQREGYQSLIKKLVMSNKYTKVEMAYVLDTVQDGEFEQLFKKKTKQSGTSPNDGTGNMAQYLILGNMSLFVAGKLYTTEDLKRSFTEYTKRD
ncbi:hypothetical protein [Paenibacillus sp. Soil750]|uniref:hypothetical protein n=1 Tax=Paenibacillus sp. Soil750 TaxID=1736398 RepID=UPI0006F2C95B|nr:hypothetical protein [Paenibacillus sp. Soil750]KRE55925.1 hypothetical protein ASL11_34905 [Paenibacillus sp. Soil750]